jgi:hypothetical protein
MSVVLSVFVSLLPAVASAPTCLEEMRICPTDNPIGSSLFELAYSRSVIRSRETPLGNLVAGASHSFRHCPNDPIARIVPCHTSGTLSSKRELGCFRYNYAPGEYITFVNAGGIRAAIPKGPVTLDTIKNVVPFGNEVRLVVANGTTVRAMLEHSVEANEPQGSFLVVAGLRFWWNPAKPPLSRVVRVEVR